MKSAALMLLLVIAGCASTEGPKVAPPIKIEFATIDPRLSRTPTGPGEIPPSVANADGKVGLYLDELQPILREDRVKLKACVGRFLAYRSAVEARDALQGAGSQ